MLRALFLFLGLVGVAAAAAWFADHPGRIVLDWQDRRIETSAALAGALMFASLAAVLALHRVWRWLVNGPEVWRGSRRERRQARGYAALTEGLVAVAAGDAGQGHKLARRAAGLLENAPLTLLLSAQAAQLNGDDDAALRYFEALEAEPETRFLGLRGLLVLAKRAGQQEQVRRLAEEAFGLRPDADWAAGELYLAQAEAGEWRAAFGTAEGAGKGKGADAVSWSRRRALALYGVACRAEADGAPRIALGEVKKALKIAPDFVPALVLAVQLHAAAGEIRPARRLLSEAWGRAAHPALAALLFDLEPAADAKARLAAAEAFVQTRPDDLESHILIAASALEADALETARAHLDSALEGGDGRRLCLLRARLGERSEEDPSSQRRWLERAALAPPEPLWLCQSCGWRAEEWRAVCPPCGEFDSLAWARPAGDSRALTLPAAAPPPAMSDAIAPPAELLQMDSRDRDNDEGRADA